MTIYSNKKQLKEIADYLTAYMRIPYFQEDTIPGKIMEKIISIVHGGEQLATYDYVDVCKKGRIGWQVKSTKEDTPLTWKRAKIANSSRLIIESERNPTGLKKLGDAIIEFCNDHAKESILNYNLEEIGYSRLIMFDDCSAIYFERLICTKSNPQIFNKDNYTWRWSIPKNTTKKEQLPALHGTDLLSNKKAFAWHGRGENQLHFSGEKDWWPALDRPSQPGIINYSKDGHAIAFKLPQDKVPWENLVEFINESN